MHNCGTKAHRMAPLTSSPGFDSAFPEVINNTDHAAKLMVTADATIPATTDGLDPESRSAPAGRSAETNPRSSI